MDVEVFELDSTIAEDLNSSSLRRTGFGTQIDDAVIRHVAAPEVRW
jgi:hypothetical protein